MEKYSGSTLARISMDHPVYSEDKCSPTIDTPTRSKFTDHHDAEEPILKENPSRFCLFPIQKHRLFDMYKKQSAVFWFAEEVDLTKDLKDWEKLNENEQYFIKNVLGFFAGSDGIVQENLATRFMREVQLPEARAFYAMQNAIEAVHSEVYSLLIDQYVRDSTEKMKLFHAIDTVPCVAKKAKWAQKWIEAEDTSFASRLVAFAIVEGIFFSGSFCSIFWLKERGLMPGLTFSNKLIARDEGLHMEFACELYRELVWKLTQEQVESILKEAVAIEKEFVCDSLPVRLIGMNSDLMCQYIEYVADRLAKQLGYMRVFGAENPFGFMERISMESRTNFFEHRVAEYAKAGVGKKGEDMVFSVDEAF